MNDAKTSVRPRRWRLQFSLKLLLVAFTAFAIGFPIWYRWPYEEVEDISPTSKTKRVTTWQRQWGGGRLMHGVQRVTTNLGPFNAVETTTYRNGQKHGAYDFDLGPDGLKGQYADDVKEGVWLATHKSMVTRSESWHRGKLDGPMEVKQPPARPARPVKAGAGSVPTSEWQTIRLTFSAGRLTHFDGKPILDANGKSPVSRLFELKGSGLIDVITDAELGKSTTIDIVEMPLKDVVLYLSETHNLHIILDPLLGKKNYELPLTASYRYLELNTALLLLTARRGLACDYRYGCIWITTAEDSSDWRDPTGVSEIKPPKDSSLGRAWNEIAPRVDTVNTPLTDILAYLKQPLAIDIDTSQLEETTGASSPPLVTYSLRGLRFCDVLGQLLYKTHCRCRIEGDKLVILPPNPEPKKQPD